LSRTCQTSFFTVSHHCFFCLNWSRIYWFNLKWFSVGYWDLLIMENLRNRSFW
jgi:hypothetical protein